jgi:hypothetical protein
MATQTNVNINRQDPEIEAFRVGLLEDSQQLVRDQIFGRNVQNLRAQGLDDAAIAARLGRGVADVSNISQDQLFGPPEYTVAGISGGEQRAIDLAQSGVGAYQPYLDQAGLGLADASALLNEAAGGFRGVGDAARQEALAGQAGLAEAIRGGRDVAAGTQADITDAVNAQRAIAGGAGEALVNQALQGQRGLTGAATTGSEELARQAAQGQAGIRAATDKSAAEALAGQSALGATTDFARNIASTGASGLLGEARTGQEGAQTAADRARASTLAAQRSLADAGQFGRGAAESGIGQLAGTIGGFDPSAIQDYMNPYEQAVIDAAMQDVARAGAIQRNQMDATAVGAGAFGGSRQGVQAAEIGRNVIEQQAKTAAGLRQAGYESAAQRAQKAFEDRMGRGQSAAMGTGQLGQAGAATQIDAAGRGGQLGLGAESLAQTGSLQGAQLGLSAVGQGSQLGMDAAGLGQRGDIAGTQFGMSAADAARAGATTGAQLGMDAAGRGMQARMDAAGQGAQLGMGAAETGARLGMGAESAGISGADIYGRYGMGAEDAAARGAIAGTGLGMDAIRTGMSADQGIAGLGGQMAGMGMNYANLGQLLSGLSASDIDRLMTTGGLQRGITQSELDANRMTNLQNYSQPFQQYGFLSDIYSQVPTGSSTMQVSSMPQANPFQTAVGLGIGAYGAMSGAQQAGIF